MKKQVIIVAGGSGKRMGTNVPKQFLLLQGKPVLMYTIENFYHYDQSCELILVLPENQIDYWNHLCTDYQFFIPHKVVNGGSQRCYSVKNGLAFTQTANALIAIHDGVRPFASFQTLESCFSIAGKKGNAVPCVPVIDSLRHLDGERNTVVDRAEYVRIQTPQVFCAEQIHQAYSQVNLEGFTDDAGVVEAAGFHINLVDGNIENIKITTQMDLVWADLLISENNQFYSK